MSRWWHVDKTFRATMTYVEIHSPQVWWRGCWGVSTSFLSCRSTTIDLSIDNGDGFQMYPTEALQ
jgi:hypothetical protein